MDQYFNNNKQKENIQNYILKCSIGDWFVLYMMNKNMNKRFFAEFVASLSLRVNPLPAEEDEPEINVIKDKLGDDDDSNYIDVAEYTQYTVHRL